MDLITPHHPSLFPPRLKKISHLALLKQAHRAWENYRKKLTEVPDLVLLSHFLTIETLDTLTSQKSHPSLQKVFFSDHLNQKCSVLFRYQKGLRWGLKTIQKDSISRKWICSLHKKIQTEKLAKKDIGHYRNRQNWIGPANRGIEKAYFIPPPPEEVDPLMKQWIRYWKKKEKDPLIHIALLFAQLLIIHPFMDGNGRVARTLIPLFFYEKKEIPFPCFSLSAYFKQHRLRYFQTLYDATKDHSWKTWFSFFFKGMISESKKREKQVEQILKLYRLLEKEKISKRIRLLLFRHPVFSSSQVSKASLRTLQKTKQIKQLRKGIYCFIPLIKILEQ